jgi:hypothetical protein
MNIFVTDECPVLSAAELPDKHITFVSILFYK